MGAADDPEDGGIDGADTDTPASDPDTENGSAASSSGVDGTGGDDPPEEADIEDVLAELEALEETVDTGEERQQVRRAMQVARRVRGGIFGGVVRGYDAGDVAEALLGSLLFGIPMAVEGGTNEAGAFLAARPPLVVGTALFAVVTVVGVLYVSDIQDVRVHRPVFGVVPRRLIGVVGVSFSTAVVLLTAWGRIDWADPRVALATVVVAFVPMSIGAALGDILPES